MEKEFGFEKCSILIMKNENKEIKEGIELWNQEIISTANWKKKISRTWEYWKGASSNKQKRKKKMKEEIRKEYLKRIKIYSEPNSWTGISSQG